MDVFKKFATDAGKELNGVWAEVGDGASLLVARLSNRKYARLLSQQVEVNQRVLDLKNEAADDLSEKIMVDVFAQTILLSWKGIEFKGEVLPPSVDNAKKLLEVKDFMSLVRSIAGDIERYRLASEEAAAKN